MKPKKPIPTCDAELRDPMYTNRYEYAILFPNAHMDCLTLSLNSYSGELIGWSAEVRNDI
jgi:hypothetical protein